MAELYWILAVQCSNQSNNDLCINHLHTAFTWKKPFLQKAKWTTVLPFKFRSNTFSPREQFFWYGLRLESFILSLFFLNRNALCIFSRNIFESKHFLRSTFLASISPWLQTSTRKSQLPKSSPSWQYDAYSSLTRLLRSAYMSKLPIEDWLIISLQKTANVWI